MVKIKQWCVHKEKILNDGITDITIIYNLCVNVDDIKGLEELQKHCDELNEQYDDYWYEVKEIYVR